MSNTKKKVGRPRTKPVDPLAKMKKAELKKQLELAIDFIDYINRDNMEAWQEVAAVEEKLRSQRILMFWIGAVVGVALGFAMCL